MSTSPEIPTTHIRRRRGASAALALAVAVAVGLPHAARAADVPPTTVPAGHSLSADAAEQWVPQVGDPSCRADAALRWQGPQIAPADLPFTADAAERWLTPEIAISDLPFTPDAAEHWLCAP